MPRYRLGVDIGGTFTDFLLLDEETGDHQIIKVASVADHPSQAILDGLRQLAEAHHVEPSDIVSFVHGTTLAVNTLIQRSGATVGLLVTDGYRDILALARLRLADPSQLYSDKSAPLVHRRFVREIRERLLASGAEYLPLDLDQVEQAGRELVAGGAEALAIAFLHAYRNPAHEIAAKARIARAFPYLYVCTSSEIWPQQREYERTLIATMNAHIGHRMEAYFTQLEEELTAIGLKTAVYSTKSNGGIMTAGSAASVPVETLLSGPASGVIGASFIAQQIGHSHVITLDMGGTSADVSVIAGDVTSSTESRIGDFPLVMPAIDISSIGAGGGSVAWLDDEDVLKVGPRSLGAYPGPACYGRGGTEPTVTDAYVTLGIIDPHHFLGGQQQLDPERSLQAFAPIANRLACSPAQVARYVLDVATANMYAQFIPLMARHGVDARDFALLAYGGAGPTHAFLLAREVGIDRVIIPLTPGVLCALGCLVADFRADFIRTVHMRCALLAAGDLERRFQYLQTEATQWLGKQRAAAGHQIIPQFVRTADVRYLGQSFELTVSAPALLANVAGAPDLLDAFHRHYAEVYGYADPGAEAEVINIRVQIVGQTVKPRIGTAIGQNDGRVTAGNDRTASPQPARWQTVSLEEPTWHVPIYERASLQPQMTFAGPCIIEQYDTTVFVTPEFTVMIDLDGNIVATRQTMESGQARQADVDSRERAV
ncbi:MAG: hydantoinase/oxoprolinase family protein [Chloroflexota bacterium]|nr:hydantoinase/oxoprolinase family protein [Chloroflexota bacterium]